MGTDMGATACAIAAGEGENAVAVVVGTGAVVGMWHQCGVWVKFVPSCSLLSARRTPTQYCPLNPSLASALYFCISNALL